jgi:hypothetical protein
MARALGYEIEPGGEPAPSPNAQNTGPAPDLSGLSVSGHNFIS